MSLSAAPRWLFSRDVLGRLPEHLVAQLPLGHRALLRYCQRYLRRHPDEECVRFASRVFPLLVAWHRLGRRDTAAHVRVDGHHAVLDLSDPRYLQVLLELQGHAPTSILSALLAPGDTFVDLGANQGGFAVVASDLVGHGGAIVAVEAQARLCVVLRKSLALGPAPATVVHTAVGAADGSVLLHVPRSYSGMASVSSAFASRCGEIGTERVPLCRLDTLLADWHPRGDVLIKLDIEGSELACLQGATQTLDRLRPRLLLECNPEALRASDAGVPDLIALLRALRYDYFSPLADISLRVPLESLTPTVYSDIVAWPT